MLKNSLFVLVMAFVLVACGGAQKANDEKPAVDTDKVAAPEAVKLTDGSYAVAAGSTLKWEGKKLAGTSSHNGGISVSKGEFTVEGGVITAGSFEIDMASITNEDIKEEEDNKNLVGHLSSADFFDVKEFPTASFTITKATPAEGGSYKLDGDFTLKGKTKPLTFTATFAEEAGAITSKAKFTFDRALWDVKYGSKNFFVDLAADKVISNDIAIAFDLKAEKAQMEAKTEDTASAE